MNRKPVKNHKQNRLKYFKNIVLKYLNTDKLKEVILTNKHLDTISVLLLICEVILGVFIINNVKYTEIDWKAYMQEVEGFLNGTLDYGELKGDTGPLVYPGGFVYLFSLLYFLTGRGNDIRLAQYLYLMFYLILLQLVFRLYRKSKKVPAYCLVIMCFTTYRIHSLFVLRLFNDPIAVILFYASLNLMLDDKWSLGSTFYSLAVSVKMNILLYSPALLLAYLNILGLKKTIFQLFLCASIQVIIGLPFILYNPYSYIKGSFDFGRVFLYQWTVNWRFLPEYIFLNRWFHLFLLLLHISLLCVFLRIINKYFNTYAKLKYIQSGVKSQLKKKSAHVNMDSVVQLFLFPFFVVNFIGIICGRSLHYQFYVWYYHSIPYLLWCCNFSVISRLTLLGVIELCWNIYPSTNISSIVLLMSHLMILVSLYIKGKNSIGNNK